MQMNRLFEMVYLLLDRKNMTSKELAAHFEVSVRTILRDIETLSMAGIPIYTVQGKGGGVRLMEQFVLNKSVLTDQEQHDILSALQGLSAIEVPDVDKVLAKLGTLFHKNATAWIDIDFSPWDSCPGEREKFPLLRDAILARRCITFDYYNFYGEKSQRMCEPLQIVFKEKAWYLSAFSKERADYRTFKISRMANLVVTEEGYEPREIRKLTGIIASDNLCIVTLKMEEDLFGRICHQFRTEEVVESADGTYQVKVFLPDDFWGHQCLLSLGEQVEVLEPAHVRRIIQEKLQKAVKKYL